MMNVLGIETSCDETSAAVISNGCAVRSNVVASQAALHARYGGVVPEVASRKHVECIIPTIQEALAGAGISYSEISAIAVTNRPGLLGALLVGVTTAKSLSYLLKIPVTAVHHLEGHVYSSFLAQPDLLHEFPILVLIVSGGHTQIVRMDGHGLYTVLGKTRDDAAGEAFDKGARLLGLNYPGGPSIAVAAEGAAASNIRFPRSYPGDGLDFSFSGVKTALRSFLQKDAGATPAGTVAAAYQDAIADALATRVKKAVETTGIHTVCVVGGVAANRCLRARLESYAALAGVRLVIPSPELCTDNAAMIACAGYYRLQNGAPDELTFDTLASEPIEG